MQVHGRKWTKIGDLMGLSQYQVKNAYNTLNNGKTRNTGAPHQRSLAHSHGLGLAELNVSAQGLKKMRFTQVT